MLPFLSNQPLSQSFPSLRIPDTANAVVIQQEQLGRSPVTSSSMLSAVGAPRFSAGDSFETLDFSLPSYGQAVSDDVAPAPAPAPSSSTSDAAEERAAKKEAADAAKAEKKAAEEKAKQDAEDQKAAQAKKSLNLFVKILKLTNLVSLNYKSRHQLI